MYHKVSQVLMCEYRGRRGGPFFFARYRRYDTVHIRTNLVFSTNLVFLSSDGVTSVSFSPCGGRIASASYDQTIKVWEASTGTCQSTLSGHDGVVGSVCFSPDGKKIVSSGGDKTVRIWDAATGAAVGSPLTGHRYVPFPCIECFLSYFGTDLVFLTSSRVTSVAYSPCGKWIASSSSDKTVRIWDAATGAPVGSPLTDHRYVPSL